MIEALVFDWGGVFQRTTDPCARHALDRELGLELGGVEKAVFESAIWEEASTGHCTAKRAWATIAASVGWPQDQLVEFVERFFSGDTVDQELVSLVRDLRSVGVPVALLSNAPPGLEAGTSAGRWGMEGLFDVQVFSYQVGALKPDRRLYEAVLALLHAPAERVLFVDDSVVNVEGARSAGMQALHFTGVQPLLEALAFQGRLPDLGCHAKS